MTIKEYFAQDPFAKKLGAKVLEISEGFAKISLIVTSSHINAYGICHGGVMFSLADIAFAAAVNSHDVVTLTTGGNISYFYPVHLGDHLNAEANEIIDHHHLPFAEVRITNQSGTLVALFTASGYRKDMLELDRSI